MSFGLIDPDEVNRHVRKRINEGWVLLIGNGSPIEEAYFTPGTEENRNFEAYFGPAMGDSYHRMITYCLFKPNKKWNEHFIMNNKNAGLEIEPKDVVMVVAFEGNPAPMQVCSTLRQEGFDRIDSIRAWFAHLQLDWEASWILGR